MTDLPTQGGTAVWDKESHGVAWHLELDRLNLLPGRLVGGRVSLRASKNVEARGVAVALVATEHWQHRVVRHGGKNSSRTEIVTNSEELLRQPVVVHGALRLASGDTWSAEFELPVPPMGPATLRANYAGLEWTLEAKLDIDDRFDSKIEAQVIVGQPVALVRSGSIPVAELALHETADVIGDGLSGSITLAPMPLVTGEPFSGRLELRLAKAFKVQEIRAELRADVAATVQSGVAGPVVLWSGVLAPAGSFEGTVTFEITGVVANEPLPTIELPHGASSGSFHVILARALKRDTHLVRDVTIATTSEV